jgi:hypothetical protein
MRKADYETVSALYESLDDEPPQIEEELALEPQIPEQPALRS